MSGIDKKINESDTGSLSGGIQTNLLKKPTIFKRDFGVQVKMADSTVYQILRFNGQNYHLWKRQMLIYMTENKLKKYILGTEVRPATNSDQWDEKDAEAQAFLMRGLELEQLKYLSDCDTAAQMWSELQTVHSQKSAQSVNVLLDQFVNYKYKPGNKMKDHVADVVAISRRLKDMDMEQKEPVVIAKILGSLPSKYDHVRTAWYAVPKPDQKIRKLMEHLVNEEALVDKKSDEEVEHESDSALFSQSNFQHSRGRGHNRGRGQSRGRGQAQGFVQRSEYQTAHSNNFNSNRGQRSWRPGVCSYCKQPGHWARECGARANGNQTLGQRGSNQTFVAQSSPQQQQNVSDWNTQNVNSGSTQSDRACLLTAVEAKCFNVVNQDAWYADSGATDHMSYKREWFKNFKLFTEKNFSVRIGDGSRIFAAGRGDIDVQINGSDGSEKIITIMNVLYVPKIEKNLLSITKVTEKGVRVIFMEGGQKVLLIKEGSLMAGGVKERNLYRLDFQPLICGVANVNVATGESLMTWHQRMGHVNFKTLRGMIQRGVVDDLRITELSNENPFCQGCVYGKQHRTSFPKNEAVRSNIPGEIFHVDLCGKMPNQSIGGANYFMLLKDDCTRYCFIYFLKDKTDVLDFLQQFYANVRADGHKIKRLRSDCGLEFLNADVKQFLLSKGIKHELSTPRAPEQNGYIERQNRTVIESAKSMLHARNLPEYLWAEAACTAVYVKNRTASHTLGGITPFEGWFGVKPNVSHLRIFDSECYVHVPKEQRTKWEVNSTKCQLVGYSEGNKAYRVYDSTRRKIYIRRDVIFDEKSGQSSSHTVIESRGSRIDNGDSRSTGAEGDEKLSDEVFEEKKKWKNPRLPIPRDPYPKRSTSSRSSISSRIKASLVSHNDYLSICTISRIVTISTDNAYCM